MYSHVSGLWIRGEITGGPGSSHSIRAASVSRPTDFPLLYQIGRMDDFAPCRWMGFPGKAGCSERITGTKFMVALATGGAQMLSVGCARG